MIVIPEMKHFNIADCLMSSPLGIEICSEELRSWFQQEYYWERPQIFLCLTEDGEPDCVMCRERDDTFFIRDPQYKDIVLLDDNIIISQFC